MPCLLISQVSLPTELDQIILEGHPRAVELGYLRQVFHLTLHEILSVLLQSWHEVIRKDAGHLLEELLPQLVLFLRHVVQFLNFCPPNAPVDQPPVDLFQTFLVGLFELGWAPEL